MCTGRNSVPCCHFSSVMCCMHVVCWVSACSLDGNTFCILFTTFPWEGSRAVQLWSCRRLSSRSTTRRRRERVRKPIGRSLRRSISSRFKQMEDHPAPPPKKKVDLISRFFLARFLCIVIRPHRRERKDENTMRERRSRRTDKEWPIQVIHTIN